MKAVGYRIPGPLDRDDALIDFEMETPVPTGHDLLVRIQAVSVNPVDYKIRMGRPAEGDTPAVLGWDAVGEVVATGDQATTFKPGDVVWYAGAINRPGTNAEFHLVDERIVGRKPASVSAAAAAALPLTSLTAHEMLFDRLRVTEPVPGAAPAILIIGGSGGVGSIAIQLLRALTDLTVIATASRPETQAWVRELGAAHVIDHTRPLTEELRRIGIDDVTHVASLTNTDDHFVQIVEAVAPQGRVALIDDPEPIDVRLLKKKSVSLHWELMFTRSMFATADMDAQQHLLDEVARLVDAGVIRSTLAEHFGAITAANLERAHELLRSGKSRGKIVLEGFGT